MIPTLRQTLFAAIPIMFIAVPLFAQRASQHVPDVEIQIHVKYEDNGPLNSQIKLDLTNESGIPISQGFTDSEGRVSFHVAAQGMYLVQASGTDIEETTPESVRVDPTDHLRVVFLRVKRKSGAVQSVAASGNGAVTSAAQLRVPQNARKAFDKGVAAWQKKDYQKAAEEFEKAVAAYSEYDMAYNNLGVMYTQLNQSDKAMAALQRAVQLNDKNADADRNLAKILLHKKEYAQAEDLLKKSLAVQTPDAPTLTMLCVAEMQNGQVDDALRDAQKVHGLPHEGYAVSHFVAGAALEEKQQYAQARAEYEMYLHEDPNGPDVPQVKSALERLSASSAAPPPGSK